MAESTSVRIPIETFELDNGLFVGVATEVLVGEVKDGQASVRKL